MLGIRVPMLASSWCLPLPSVVHLGLCGGGVYPTWLLRVVCTLNRGEPELSGGALKTNGAASLETADWKEHVAHANPRPKL